LESRPPSHQTEGPSSRPPCGRPCAACSTSSTRPQTAYHPQSNGLVQRFHRRLKDALRSWAAADDWHDHLSLVMLCIGASFRENSEFSPAEALFAHSWSYPASSSTPPSRRCNLFSRICRPLGPPPRHRRHGTARLQPPSTLLEELLLARFVLVCWDSAQPPLSSVYDGPYLVFERSTHFFLLQIGERTDKVSALRLKQARTPADTEPSHLPRRGRPVVQALPVRTPPPPQRGRL
jgi:hypothetical protein